MTFEEILPHLKNGRKAARLGWNGKNMYVGIQYPDKHSANTEPYFYMRTAQGGRIPWTISHSDALHGDWQIVQLKPSTLSPTV